MKRSIHATLSCILLSVLVSTAYAAPPLSGIPLSWMPKTSMAGMGPLDMRGPLSSAHLRVEPFKDSREQPALIGQNLEKKQPRPVTTSGDVAGFVTQHLSDSLRAAGLSLVDDHADYTITGDIKTFFVTETDTYRGEIAVLVHVRDAAGKEVWSGFVNGAGNNFGRSYKAVNYYQTIADMVMQASHNLAQNLSQALEQRAGAATGAGD